ncbi:hypothetical protein EW146_g8998 [Bondarzewia mesenterica]|uniref:Uncharacterized protein n=1 Tax=Bondarzewia mesenterica TaxID=1095465 RepID=A0A4S4LAA3_9AGAM|nr:hypothetical protein EW146_g8998 [Bondarzewia mesenterica]
MRRQDSDIEGQEHTDGKRAILDHLLNRIQACLRLRLRQSFEKKRTVKFQLSFTSTHLATNLLLPTLRRQHFNLGIPVDVVYRHMYKTSSRAICSKNSPLAAKRENELPQTWPNKLSAIAHKASQAMARTPDSDADIGADIDLYAAAAIYVQAYRQCKSMNISTDSSLTCALGDELLARRPCNTAWDRAIPSSAEKNQQKRMESSKKRIADEDSNEGGEGLPEGEGCGDDDHSPSPKKRRVDETKPAEVEKGGSPIASHKVEGKALRATNDALQDGSLEVFFLEPLSMPGIVPLLLQGPSRRPFVNNSKCNPCMRHWSNAMGEWHESIWWTTSDNCPYSGLWRY